MKNLIAFTLLLFVGFAATAQANMKFDQEVIDYGNVEYNADGVRTFVVTNIGNEPLIISDVKSTCGCTVPEKPKNPIAPGESAEIKVKYNTTKVGLIRKTITVYANTENSPFPLKIKGNVQAQDTKSELEK
ncbi:DUF1573 domain-containing protein [Mesonia sp. K7]|uniref:DUF1573 domain-containing protein n=1 Tax=Mesonia sp. K7 TaxID=2218606 RepID=UPI000DA86DC6|nr:DUF1573 domain-containing protein [Mesonia sp. K7]PZD76787.1 hypothetical protein DNG35_11035 [Mesonia sp. K7]